MSTTGRSFVKGARHSAPSTLTAERTRLDRARADLAEHQLALKRAEFVRVEEVGERWVRLVTNVRNRILGVPSKLAPALARTATPAQAAAILEEEILAALDELSADPFGRRKAKRTTKAKR